MKKIVLVLPTLSSGGAERVMSVLANKLSEDPLVEVHLILYLSDERFFELNEKIKVYSPQYKYKNYSKSKSLIKTFRYLRATLKEIKPYTLLSFGGKYNSLVLLSSLGLSINCYVSDRSRPDISYGKIQDLINPIVYRFSKGIIAQTSKAKEAAFINTNHKNIVIIPNPIPNVIQHLVLKEKIILNVGRFIASKQQIKLIEVFSQLQNEEWQLIFLGEGEHLEKCKEEVVKLNMQDQIKFLGVQKDITYFLSKSSVFAFTSISEGFPNSLAEAMAAGCACISFDCIAGPSDIIDNKYNGFLIPLNDWEKYTESLNRLLRDDNLRDEFSHRAKDKSLLFSEEKIVLEFKKTLLS